MLEESVAMLELGGVKLEKGVVMLEQGGATLEQAGVILEGVATLEHGGAMLEQSRIILEQGGVSSNEVASVLWPIDVASPVHRGGKLAQPESWIMKCIVKSNNRNTPPPLLRPGRRGGGGNNHQQPTSNSVMDVVGEVWQFASDPFSTCSPLAVSITLKLHTAYTWRLGTCRLGRGGPQLRHVYNRGNGTEILESTESATK
jgi:exonuclease VII small subunit